MGKSATRRKHTNSKLGCANCKRKKIRCDEGLPQCENCQRARKETCSYLSLSSAEINRIRLTHSLRNSQNRLLSSNFRLPTSTNNSFEATDLSNGDHVKDHGKSASEDALQFEFEFCVFRNQFPTSHYLSIRFHNTFMNTVELDEKSDSDYRSSTEAVSSERSTSADGLVNGKSRALPNSVPSTAKFARIDYRARFDSSRNRYNPMCTMMWHFNPEHIFSETFFICQRSFAASLALVRGKQAAAIGYPAGPLKISALEYKANATVNVMRLLFPDALRNFKENLAEMCHTMSEISRQRLYLVLANWLCACSLAALDCSIPTVFTFLVGQSMIFEKYIIYAMQYDEPGGEGTQWLSFLKENILFIHLPPYEPAFLHEISSNLEALRSVFDDITLTFKNEDERLFFETLRYYCRQMSEYLDSQILNVIYLSRNEHFVTICPPTVMFNAIRKWWFLMPSKFDAPSSVPANSVIKQLESAVKMYRAAIGVGIDAVFPTARYLFSLGFEDPTFTFEEHCTLLKSEVSEIGVQMSELIWRHGVYASRVYGFFSRRFRMYKNNVIWKGPFKDVDSNNRFSARHMKNVLEIPVRSFNNLALRPEHYARQIHQHYNSILKDPSTSAVFTRPEDPRDQYYPKDDSFDLFDSSRDITINKDLSCDVDYVPNIGEYIEKDDFTTEDLRRYLEDRIIILQGIF